MKIAKVGLAVVVWLALEAVTSQASITLNFANINGTDIQLFNTSAHQFQLDPVPGGNQGQVLSEIQDGIGHHLTGTPSVNQIAMHQYGGSVYDPAVILNVNSLSYLEGANPALQAIAHAQPADMQPLTFQFTSDPSGHPGGMTLAQLASGGPWKTSYVLRACLENGWPGRPARAGQRRADRNGGPPRSEQAVLIGKPPLLFHPAGRLSYPDSLSRHALSLAAVPEPTTLVAGAGALGVLLLSLAVQSKRSAVPRTGT